MKGRAAQVTERTNSKWSEHNIVMWVYIAFLFLLQRTQKIQVRKVSHLKRISSYTCTACCESLESSLLWFFGWSDGKIFLFTKNTSIHKLVAIILIKKICIYPTFQGGNTKMENLNNANLEAWVWRLFLQKFYKIGFCNILDLKSLIKMRRK